MHPASCAPPAPGMSAFRQPSCRTKIRRQPGAPLQELRSRKACSESGLLFFYLLFSSFQSEKSVFSRAQPSRTTSSMISLQVCSFVTIPAHCPAITVPFTTSPSMTAFLKEPRVRYSSCSKEAPSVSSFSYSLVILLRIWRTGCPVLMPVTSESMSRALITFCL